MAAELAGEKPVPTEAEKLKKIESQKAAISKLQEQNKKLRSKLIRLNAADPVDPGREVHLQEVLDVYQHKLDEERRQLAALENEVDVTQAKVAAQRKQQATLLTPDQEVRSISKHVQILEAHLERSLSKFDQTLAGNRQLREDVEKLQREVGVLQEMHGRHSAELQVRRDELAQLEKVIRSGNEAAQEGTAQAEALLVLDEREQRMHDEEVAALERLQDKVGQLAEAQERRGAAGPNVAASDDSLESVDRLWLQLQRACGVGSREEVVKAVESMEEQNITMFETCSRADQTVSGLQQEVDRLAAEVWQLEEEMLQVRSKGFVKELQVATEQLRQRSRKCEEKASASTASLQNLVPAVSALARTVEVHARQCDGTDMQALHQQLLQQLSSIEIRARIIMSVYGSLMTGKLTA